MVQSSFEQVFDSLYERNFSLLMGILVRMAGNKEAAEDLCQEAFVKLHQRLAGEKTAFPSLDEARFWLIRVAKNLALNYQKRRTRELAAYKKTLRKELIRRPHEPSTEQLLLKKELSLKVQEALLLMPEKLREALVLKEYGDLPYKDIAVVLKINEGNVKVRVFRAREWFAARFGNLEEMNVS